ncbi:protein of unknown function [Candidatus Methylocalor cossyra]|uniref:Uncharacterized protein n=1 Tax=Candidatus Methylocalor cossyra TaxID=3108543 RepID=A0ABP1C3Y9_9GAMM
MSPRAALETAELVPPGPVGTPSKVVVADRDEAGNVPLDTLLIEIRIDSRALESALEHLARAS